MSQDFQQANKVKPKGNHWSRDLKMKSNHMFKTVFFGISNANGPRENHEAMAGLRIHRPT